MKSQRSYEGYLMLDNRSGPGLSDAMVVAAGMPVGAGHGLFEAPTYTCSHCQAIVILNPARNRERAYCPKCSHHVCDRCGAVRAANGGLCTPIKQIIDEVQEAAETGRPMPLVAHSLANLPPVGGVLQS